MIVPALFLWQNALLHLPLHGNCCCRGAFWDHGLAPLTPTIPRPAMVDLRKRQSAIDPYVLSVWSSSLLNIYILSFMVISHLNNYTNSLSESLWQMCFSHHCPGLSARWPQPTFPPSPKSSGQNSQTGRSRLSLPPYPPISRVTRSSNTPR